MNEKQSMFTQVEDDGAVKQRKPRGMRYFGFVYAVQCPSIMLFYFLFGIVSLYMPRTSGLPFVAALLCMALFFSEVVLACVAMAQYWKNRAVGRYPAFLYSLTQTVVWGSGLCWAVLYASVGLVLRAMAAAIVIVCVLFLIIPLIQFFYFRNRKDVYGHSTTSSRYDDDLSRPTDGNTQNH